TALHGFPQQPTCVRIRIISPGTATTSSSTDARTSPFPFCTRYPLHFRRDSLHIPPMARSPKKSSASNPGNSKGFEEAPQSSFKGAPLEGSVSDWVKQMEAEAEASGVETQREIASKAGKHRKRIEIAAREEAIKAAAKDKPKTAQKAAQKTA